MIILWYLVLVFLILLIVRMIASWIAVPPSGPFATVVSIAHRATEPVLRPLRDIIPPVRMGAVGLDLSVTVVFIVCTVLLSSIPH